MEWCGCWSDTGNEPRAVVTKQSNQLKVSNFCLVAIRLALTGSLTGAPLQNILTGQFVLTLWNAEPQNKKSRMQSSVTTVWLSTRTTRCCSFELLQKCWSRGKWQILIHTGCTHCHCPVFSILQCGLRIFLKTLSKRPWPAWGRTQRICCPELVSSVMLYHYCPQQPKERQCAIIYKCTNGPCVLLGSSPRVEQSWLRTFLLHSPWILPSCQISNPTLGQSWSFTELQALCETAGESTVFSFRTFTPWGKELDLLVRENLPWLMSVIETSLRGHEHTRY